MPYSSFFSFGGTLPPSAPSYIERRADEDLWQTLLERDYALILDSRQKGKSSLISRISKRLETESFRSIKIDLQRFGSNLTEEQWYATLLFGCAEQLADSEQARAHWKGTPNASPSRKWIDYLESAVRKSEHPLVVWIDEIDFVRSLKFDTDDFFAAIRSSYLKRTDEPALRNLVFCFTGACTPVGLVRNPDRGQVILGRRIQLDDFTIQDLTVYGRELSEDESVGKALIASVFAWTNGHPYLTQLACNEWKRRTDRGEKSTIDEFFSEQLSTVGNRYQSDHLLAISNLLLNPTIPHYQGEEARTRVLKALQSIQAKATWQGRRPIDPEVQDYLAISGVITERDGRIQIRNRIYSEAFDSQWIRDHLPDAEAQRQKKAVRQAVGTSVAVFGAITMALSLLVVQNTHLNNDLRQTLTLAKNNESRALNEAYVGGMQSVSAEISDGNYSRAATILESLKDSPYRGWEWDYVHAKISQHLQQIPTVGTAFNFDFYPSGKLRSLVGTEGFVTFSESGSTAFEFRLPEEYNGSHDGDGPLFATGPIDTYRLVSPDSTKIIPGRLLGEGNGYRIFFKGAEPMAYLVNQSGQAVGKPVPCSASRFEFTGSGLKAAYRHSKEFNEVDFQSGKTTVRYLHSGHINQFILAPTPGTAYLASDDPEIVRVNYRTGKKEISYLGNQGPVYSIAISPDKKWLISGGADAVVRRFNLETGALVATYVGHRDRIQKVRFSLDGKSIWSSSFDETIRQWALEPVSNPAVLSKPEYKIGKLRVDSNHESFLVGFEAGKAVWYRSGVYASVIDLAGQVYAQGDFIDADTVLLATEQGQIQIRTLQTVRNVKVPVSSRIRQVTSVDSKGGVYFALDDGSVIRLDTKSLKTTSVLTPSGVYRAMALSHNGKWLVHCLFSGLVRIIDTESGKVVHQVDLGGGAAIAVGFTPSDDLVGIASGMGDINLFALNQNFQSRVLKGHTSRVWRVCFNPDGTQLATSSFDNTAKIWDVATGKMLFNLKHKSWVGDTAFSPDGKRLLTACGDGASRLWSVATGRELLVLDRGPNPLFATRFCDGGRSVVSVDSLGRVLVFTTPKEQPIAESSSQTQ